MDSNQGWNLGEVLECADKALPNTRARIQSMETRVIPQLSVIKFRSAQSALRILGLDEEKSLGK